ncbi:MAG: bifunctional phosphoribosylaminoimidazolecarboxamide formyltransferase/IMP cyclohydrolase [Nitrosomonadales bacterium]|nr:bifunctional phosphoribosylaminoimidazolecarboxamide formyltransferase/IMP cyclohydrolase [Nitrosomonadales bacterium]
MIKIKKALISVSDKSNILELAQHLKTFNIEILSTGGTAKLLKENKIQVTDVSDYTKFPEMLDGRVKTLHPKIHGGILGRRDIPEHQETMKNHKIDPIDLVIVNLYPFEATIKQENCTLDLAIENIDIGGPAMIRSAAKNYKHVAVLTNSNDYKKFSDEIIKNEGSVSEDFSFSLAKKAFARTSAYDAAINNYLTSDDQNKFPEKLSKTLNKVMDLRYGENPHQQAAFYKDSIESTGTLSSFDQLQGKELSFNNLNDSDTAWECVKKFSQPSCVIVKHANPCGVASADSLQEAYQTAFKTDPTSAFGGIIAFNESLDEKTASLIIKQFAEVIIAVDFSEAAKKVFQKKPNVRLLKIKNENNNVEFDFKKIGGGWLIQTPDNHSLDINSCKIVTDLKPSEQQLDDMKFAWIVSQYVKSNAIVFCKNKQTLGIGAGQMSRVDSTKIASLKAENANVDLTHSVVASDAFFPFRDGIDVIASHGAKCIIQPGGSIKDQEVIKAANEHDLVMLFTNIRHFKH